MHQPQSSSIESKASWVVAGVALVAMLLMSFGAAWITAVALQGYRRRGRRRALGARAGKRSPGSARGVGGILMGRVAERFGTRWTVMCGSLMIGVGLAISTLGPPWPLWIGHGLFIGLLGIGGINAPLYVYVSRWFDRRRGSALSLISSGSYLAGAVWPPVFERVIALCGWRQTMLVVRARRGRRDRAAGGDLSARPAGSRSPAEPWRARAGRVLGLPPNVVFAMMCAAAVLCCIPMAMPQGHLVAFCSDLGIARSVGAGDAVGAARHRVPEPADLGRDLRPHRRACAPC